MIVSSVQDRTLQAAIRRAARPDEDVVVCAAAVSDALRFGFPRVAVVEEGRLLPGGADGPVPSVTLTPSRVRRWRARWEAEGLPRGWVAFAADCLRPSLRNGWQPSVVDRVLRDLARASGRPLPPAFLGLARRVLELPCAYVDGGALEALTGVSAGALKARFRRRDLPSPHSYLRWLRCLAVAALLRERYTVAESARRLGWTSSGNLCRDVSVTAGLAPSRMAEEGGYEALVARFAQEHLDGRAVEEWTALDDVFLAGVA